jgi:hypothetical protein
MELLIRVTLSQKNKTTFSVDEKVTLASRVELSKSVSLCCEL